jgi:hypothetical protein
LSLLEEQNRKPLFCARALRGKRDQAGATVRFFLVFGGQSRPVIGCVPARFISMMLVESSFAGV